MFQAAIWGRLGGDPREIKTQSGTPMTVARLAADIGQEDGAEPLWLDLVGFARQAEVLAQHRKGDTLSASGRIERRTWTDNRGETHQEWRLVADSVVSAYSVRHQKSGKAVS